MQQPRTDLTMMRQLLRLSVDGVSAKKLLKRYQVHQSSIFQISCQESSQRQIDLPNFIHR